MRQSIRALALTFALLWGGCLLVVGLLNLAVPSYGSEFLRGVSSFYPGYHASRRFLDVLLGAGYGIVDGALDGFVCGWFFNLFLGRTA